MVIIIILEIPLSNISSNSKKDVSDIMFCPKCGKEVSDTTKFCASCGNQISKQEPVPEPAVTEKAEPKKISKGTRDILIILILTGIISIDGISPASAGNPLSVRVGNAFVYVILLYIVYRIIGWRMERNG